MSYGIGSWGTGSWGGADFIVQNHIPFDNSINVSRTPTISFELSSLGNTINTSTINLSANGIQLITNGIFTSKAVGIINSADPNNTIVSASVIHAFSPLSIITVVVDAQNSANEHPSPVTATWQFTVSDAIATFSTYIVRGFERVFRVGS